MAIVDPRPVGSLEARARAHWKVLLVVLGAAAAGNLAFAPGWNSLQTAGSASSFTGQLDHPLRVLAAAACDVVFAATYGVLGYAGLRRWGARNRVVSIAVVAVVLGAAFDELENATLVLNVIRRADLTDAWVDLMRIPGTLKWMAGPAVLLLYGYLIRAVSRRRRTEPPGQRPGRSTGGSRQ
jgi:hypothetical protein